MGEARVIGNSEILENGDKAPTEGQGSSLACLAKHFSEGTLVISFSALWLSTLKSNHQHQRETSPGIIP